ncbi:VOC family protein [Bradyrhizobium sp. CCBAU 21360]|nr:VOC family protein [Bradyrhizobium sp. CCBAU 21360]
MIDLGLSTNMLEPMVEFWEHEIGLRLDHVLPVRRGQKQYRFDAAGSVIKVNHHRDPLPDAAFSGYRELLIAKPELKRSRRLIDPDGNRITLVPAAFAQFDQIAVRLHVKSIEAHRAFYTNALGFSEISVAEGVGFRAGNSLLLLDQKLDVARNPGFEGKGWRYMTLQVFRVDDAHSLALLAGAREAMAPTTLGTTARISMILDPDGNWIELSQRASIVGSLD